MKLFKKGETTPFPAGTKFRIKNNVACIIGECPCTDSYLHYLVKWDKGNVTAVLHSELLEIEESAVSYTT